MAVKHETLFMGTSANSGELAGLMLTSRSRSYAKAVYLRHGQMITAGKWKAEFHGTSKVLVLVFLNLAKLTSRTHLRWGETLS